MGEQGPRQDDEDEVHRRHPQHLEHRLAAELPAEQDRPQQQLLPRDQQARQGERPDVLPEGAVHALGEHGVARPEHDEEAAQRPGVPQGARDPRSTSAGSSRPTTATSSPRRTRPGSCRPGTSGSTRPRSRASASATTSRGAKALLAANGYRDRNGDGFVENKDGATINLASDRPERLVGLDDGDPDHRRQREGRRDQDHAGIPRLRRARRRAQLGQVRPRDQQRAADRQHAVHLLRLPVPPADRRSQQTWSTSRATRTRRRGR